MIGHMERLNNEQLKDLKVLMRFIEVYCRGNHPASEKHETTITELGEKKGVSLCSECTALLSYSVMKRRKCPLDPKPSCKHCKIHCYSTEQRSKIREVMAYSGRRMIMRGKIHYLWHYFF